MFTKRKKLVGSKPWSKNHKAIAQPHKTKIYIGCCEELMDLKKK